ncbi:MAG: glycosyltransferase family 4 protein [Anaerolineaceae bacterium]|nr:glycosyltransferase family 4 protein [Anaerolineaceae bacterium]
MKIALLHYSSPPIVGGVESVLAHHARLMSKAGHDVTILAGRVKVFDKRIPVKVNPRLDSRHPDVIRVKKMLDKGHLADDFTDLRDQIEADLITALKGFDVLIAHNVASLHKNLPLTAALHQAHQIPGFPRLVLWHHDLAWSTPRYRGELHPGYPWDLLRATWNDAVHVVISETRRQELGSLLGISSDSIHVIPNGVDLDSFYKLDPLTLQIMDQLNLIEADPLFLLPVRLTPRKNIELALHIMAELHRFLPNAVLLVTGPEGPHNPANAKYKRKLLDMRDDLGLSDAALFLAETVSGFLPDAVIADLYKLADALIFPSQEEGFGIPIIEAAFSSLPVFCADIPVLRELGRDDVSYFNVDGDPCSIAKQIESRLKSEATARWARRAKHTFTWDSIYVKRIEPLLQEAA